MTEFLFSYGTLQLQKVQLETFGRILEGTPETLNGFKIERLRITNQSVLDKSEQEFHPIALPSNNKNDEIKGTLYQISSEELAHADAYEVSDYKRILVTFQSGKKGWIYIKSDNDY